MRKLLPFVIVLMLSSSCATVFTPKPTEYQRTKPKEGEPARKLRIGWLIIDALIFPPFLILDFVTHNAYKPEKKKKKEKK